MRYMKRKNIYQCSNYNCTFDPVSKRAMSYKWWCFVAEVEGKIVFNNYRYSVTTSKHQSKVRSLLNELGIKIDLNLPVPDGLPGSHVKSRVYGVSDFMKRDLSLAELIVEAEEYLCDEISRNVLKQQERNEKAKVRRLQRKLENHLDNVVHFRDYEVKPKEQFGKYDKIAVHQVVKDVERDVENALHNFHRDGFGSVVFYV